MRWRWPLRWRRNSRLHRGRPSPRRRGRVNGRVNVATFADPAVVERERVVAIVVQARHAALCPGEGRGARVARCDGTRVGQILREELRSANLAMLREPAAEGAVGRVVITPDLVLLMAARVPVALLTCHLVHGFVVDGEAAAGRQFSDLAALVAAGLLVDVVALRTIEAHCVPCVHPVLVVMLATFAIELRVTNDFARVVVERASVFLFWHGQLFRPRLPHGWGADPGALVLVARHLALVRKVGRPVGALDKSDGNRDRHNQ